jgi:hypothetical protein
LEYEKVFKSFGFISFMGVFSWFKKKKTTTKREFDQEQYELSAEVRRKRAFLRRLELDLEIEQAKQDLLSMKQEFAQDMGLDTPENLFSQLIQNALVAKGLKQPDSLQTENTLSTNEVVLTRQQIEDFIKNLSKSERAIMKFAPDDELKAAIKQKIPNISEESLNLCLEIARE